MKNRDKAMTFFEDDTATQTDKIRNNYKVKDGDYLYGLLFCYEQLQQENKQLKDNWNKLKEWLNEDVQRSFDLHFQVLRKSDILDKIQELEKGDSNECKLYNTIGRF